MNDLQIKKAEEAETPNPKIPLRVLIRADAPTYVTIELFEEHSISIPTETARQLANTLCIAADKADEIKKRFS